MESSIKPNEESVSRRVGSAVPHEGEPSSPCATGSFARKWNNEPERSSDLGELAARRMVEQ